MNDEIGIKILNLLYEQWFKDCFNGIPFETFKANISYSDNEINQTLEVLQNNWLIEKNRIGWYIITYYGIDIYEETLPPSQINKSITQRRKILEILKDVYDKDINQLIDDKSLRSLIQIDDHRYLLGIVGYLSKKNLVILEIATSGNFWIKLSPSGLESMENNTYNNSLTMKNAYSILFNIENQLRQFIECTLSIKYGSDWWNIAITQGVKKKVDQMREDELKIGWSVTNTKSIVEYLSFEHLPSIITNNWKSIFESFFQDQNKIIPKLYELETIRNAIAHTRTLTDEGIKRLELYALDIRNLINKN